MYKRNIVFMSELLCRGTDSLMGLSSAERFRCYRENLKKKGIYEEMKRKHREKQRENHLYRQHAKKMAHRCRDALRKRQNPMNTSQLTPTIAYASSAFGSAQTLGKVMKKVENALPLNDAKKIEAVKRLGQKMGLLSSSKHHRTARQLPTSTIKNVLEFFERVGISWQAPGKRDTVTVT